MPSIRPFLPAATASNSGGPGSEVNTTSADAATSRGLDGPFGAVGDQLLRRLAPQVVQHELVPRLLEIVGHARAHQPEPDESDPHVFLRYCFRCLSKKAFVRASASGAATAS